jgi:O-antigen ligase
VLARDFVAARAPAAGGRGGRQLAVRARAGADRPVVIGWMLVALVSIVTTNSRAGLGLGAAAALVVLAHQSRGLGARWRIAGLAALAVGVAGVLSSPAFRTVGTRVGDVSDDLRWQFLAWSWPLAERHGLVGSGFGSFATLFAADEQLAWVKPTFVNAAHNDWLQLVIEAGLPGVAVLALLLWSVAAAVPAAWAEARAGRREAIGWGVPAIALIAAHSLIDYPLRRPAAWIFLALALAAVYRARARGDGQAEG